jgi:hypothetical protein
VDGTRIKRATAIRKALTLELIFKSQSGCTRNGARSANTSLSMWDFYSEIKSKIRTKVRAEGQYGSDDKLFYDTQPDLL